MTTTKPIGSLSLDLDNQWSYMKTHGDPGWESFPSYLDVLVPRVLDFLRKRDLTITVFIVGQDAALTEHRDLLAAIAAAGHEIGNHSFHHEPWLHLRSEQEIEAELTAAEEHIERATGQRPLGFRGPGYSLSSATLRVLSRRGYLYDTSTLPTYLGPLARAFYSRTTTLSPEQARQRKALFGTFRDGVRPVGAHRLRVGTGHILEIPVTTMPLFKLPIHASYIIYLGTFAPALALAYFRAALRLCWLTKTLPSLLLHPLDFLGCDDTRALSFFPGMSLVSERKLEVLNEILSVLSHHFRITTMREHAQEATAHPRLPSLLPYFPLERRAL